MGSKLELPTAKAAHAEALRNDVDKMTEIKQVLRDFLTRLRYRAPQTPANPRLRAEVTAEILSWDNGLSSQFITGLADTSCSIAESTYAHTSYEHQYIIAVYTAYLTYIDDLGERNIDAVAQFVRRLLTREAFGDPAVENLVVLLRDMYKYYPRLSADSINISTLDFFVGVYVECTAKDMAIAPGATKYPVYMRTKTGIGAAYALFAFVKDWRDPADTFHLQLIPEIELYTDTINDILSFYKESLAQETDNLIHLRAAAEQKDPLLVLRELSEETLESIRKVEMLTASDPQLSNICRSYIMGYVEFHFRAKRYRLEDLEVDC
ncbi:terpenoid synthase [Trametes polyzona]|nr:terpenoid synthase [Trametes polyzona]